MMHNLTIQTRPNTSQLSNNPYILIYPLHTYQTDIFPPHHLLERSPPISPA